MFDSIDNEARLSGQCANTRCLLSQVRSGVSVRIKSLTASPDEAVRLREIGFCEERVIRLVSVSSNVICQVCNARLALGRRLAESIVVEPISPLRVA